MAAVAQRIKLAQLDYFRAVGRFQHVTRAAEHLGVSQPALSRAIANLESELGIPLFERSGRSIRLTTCGEMFLKNVERAFSIVEDGIEEIRDFSEPSAGGVSIGFLRTLGYNFIPQLVSRFQARYPTARLSLFQNNSAGLEEGMKQGRLDLAFIPRVQDPDGFSWTKLASQNLLLIVPKDHRLADRKSVSLNEVRDEPFICFKQGHAFRDLVDRIFNGLGITPSISFECDDGSYLMGFVAAGLGVAVFPPDYARVSNVVPLKISTAQARRDVGIAWPADRYVSRTTQTFIDFAKASIRPDMTLR